jgi:serine/threonine protein kinase
MSSVTSGAGRIGNYQLVARIASGGMAEIHVARGVAADAAPVAVVKRLLPEHLVDPDYVEMFVDEGRITAALDHPNVVRMFQAGFEAGVPFLAMEYLHGVDLRTLMRTAHQHGAPLPLPLALLIVRGICAGLHHAHEATTTEGQPMEVVHRDISPQNVVVTFTGDVKIVDFGIAKSEKATCRGHGTARSRARCRTCRPSRRPAKTSISAATSSPSASSSSSSPSAGGRTWCGARTPNPRASSA